MEELINNPAEIRLNNQNEIDQILGNPPGWILRWGLSLLFVATMIFGILAWWIKYPDVIPASVNLVTENPAIRVFVPSSGKIDKLLVTNNTIVKKNQLLAILGNSANAEDVETLKTFLQKAESITDFSTIKTPENLSLGEMQNTYGGLVLKIKNYHQFSGQTGVKEKTISIQQRIENIQKLNVNISKQKLTLHEEIALAKQDYERNIRLNEIGELSNSELEKSKTVYLQYQRRTEDFENRILNNNVNISALETQIIDLKEGRNLSYSDKKLAIQKNIQQLKNEISNWELSYLITAPRSGQVSFSKNWSEQQFINLNEEILTIVPTDGAGKIIGQALLPIQNSGKVEVGQTANIQLSSFPFREFGILKSTVISISEVPQGDAYFVELELDSGLKTTYDKSIPFRQEMQGTANIVTEERRVVERVFDTLLSILKNT